MDMLWRLISCHIIIIIIIKYLSTAQVHVQVPHTTSLVHNLPYK